VLQLFSASLKPVFLIVTISVSAATRRSGVDKNGEQPMTPASVITRKCLLSLGRVMEVVPRTGPNMHGMARN